MRAATETVTTVDLGYEQLLVFDGGPQARLRVLYGAAWLTEEGRPGDTIAGAGAEVALHGGRAVAEALGPSRLQIVETRRSGVMEQLGRRLHRAAHRMRRLFGRLQLGAVAAGPNV